MAFDTTQLRGDTRPLDTLIAELTAAGARFDVCLGKTSPVTGEGAQAFTADFDPNRLHWQIYGPVDAHAHALYHELLHVELYDVHGAEWLVAAPGTDVRTQYVIRELNNDLDHAIIVQAEIAAYPEAERYWEVDFGSSLDRSVAADRLNQQFGLVRGWMVVSNAMPNAPITARYRSQLITIGASDAADELALQVWIAGRDKQAILAAFRNAFGYGYPKPEHSRFHRWTAARL
ncbi:hypothetical protein ACS0ZG_36190 [Burkholderia gladioli]|uniref:hypothetical protein n=1 Tax=Burkholderia gladioli TaxID=28095 RepID=UPI003F7AD36E